MLDQGGAQAHTQNSGEAGLTASQVVARLVQKNAERANALERYQGRRSYRLDYVGFPKNLHAEMIVDVIYKAPDSKEFKVVSETGSGWMIKHILKRLLESEHEALEGANRERTTLNSKNYDFTMLMDKSTGVGCPYVLAVQPKVPNKFVYRGRIWVDAKDFAVCRIEAEPALNPSFWKSGAHANSFWRSVDRAGVRRPEHQRLHDGGYVSSTLDRNSASTLLALLLLILTAVACGGGGYSGTHQGPPPEGAPLNNLSVYAHSTPSIAVAGTVHVLADGYYDVAVGQNSYKDLTNSATWTTSNAAVATVDRGVVTGIGIGSATIMATVGTKTGSITVVVGLTPTLAITPAGTGMFSLSSTPTQQFHATATYSDGTVLDLTVFASWSESPEGVLAFNVNDPYGLNPGLATLLATGTTTITATLDTGEAGTMIVTVVP